MTQEAIADQLGVHPVTVSKWRSGQGPGLDKLDLIASKFGRRISVTFVGETESTPPAEASGAVTELLALDYQPILRREVYLMVEGVEQRVIAAIEGQVMPRAEKIVDQVVDQLAERFGMHVPPPAGEAGAAGPESTQDTPRQQR